MDAETFYEVTEFLTQIANKKNWNPWDDEFGNPIYILEWIGDAEIQVIAKELLEKLKDSR